MARAVAQKMDLDATTLPPDDGGHYVAMDAGPSAASSFGVSDPTSAAEATVRPNFSGLRAQAMMGAMCLMLL